MGQGFREDPGRKRRKTLVLFSDFFCLSHHHTMWSVISRLQMVDYSFSATMCEGKPAVCFAICPLDSVPFIFILL